MADVSTPTPLSPREAAADALHRCILGLDSNNRTLFESACVTDESMTFIGGGFAVTGWPGISALFEKAFTLITTHVTSNIRVHISDDEEKANLTAHAISYHVRPEDKLARGDKAYTAGSLYELDLVRDGSDGAWRIQRWEIEVLWTTGDKAILHG